MNFFGNWFLWLVAVREWIIWREICLCSRSTLGGVVFVPKGCLEVQASAVGLMLSWKKVANRTAVLNVQSDKTVSVLLIITYALQQITPLSQHASFLPHCLIQSDWLAADRQSQGDTRLTLTPSVIPNSNYVIMVGDWNCLKHFCVFLYCNRQVHRDFLITLYYTMVYVHNWYNVFCYVYLFFSSLWYRLQHTCQQCPPPYFLEYSRIAVHAVFYGVFKIWSCERTSKTEQIPSSSTLTYRHITSTSNLRSNLLTFLQFSKLLW
jgi:hypothetical protein